MRVYPYLKTNQLTLHFSCDFEYIFHMFFEGLFFYKNAEEKMYILKKIYIKKNGGKNHSVIMLQT